VVIGKELSMRVWDVKPEKLCRQHLLGEHREIHGIWNILTKGKKGYATHPETLRWKGRLKALYGRHQELVNEMGKRGYRHRSHLSEVLATGHGTQIKYVNSLEDQIRLLQKKGCDCQV
jgi:hypothetical protein